ncbi:MAG: hypothetical protein IIB43_07360 [Candidatus Marinimicrobia bacterium]|nr:hypothetical protein [Candidatus Neomarinimicrobiota bacterium]
MPSTSIKSELPGVEDVKSNPFKGGTTACPWPTQWTAVGRSWGIGVLVTPLKKVPGQ